MTARFGIFADDKTAAGWQSVIARAHSNGNRLKSTLTTAFAGIVGVATFTNQVAKAIEFGDEIGKLSVKLGTSAQATSELVAIAKKFDIEIGAVTVGLRKMQVGISEANSGSKAMREVFTALGLNVQQLRAQRPEQQFITIAEAISRLGNEADRARAATALFGRAGTDFLPIFERGAEGIRDAAREVREFGTVINDLDVKKLQEADDALKRLTASGRGLGITATTFFGPFLAGSADAARRLLGGATELEKLENQLRILRESDTSIPVFFNFGFTDAGGVVLGPSEIESAIDKLEKRIERLRNPPEGGGRQRGRGTVLDIAAGGPPGFAAPSNEHLLKLNRYNRLWIEFTENVEYFESVEKTRFEAEVNRIDRRNELIEDLDRSIRGSTASSREAQQEIEGVANRMEAAFEKAAASAVFVEELQKSMFSNVSGLIASAGDGWDDFADSAISAFKRLLADQATLQLFNFLGVGSNSKSGFGSFFSALFGGASGLGLADSFFAIKADTGIKRVPRDNQPFLLHKDEAVLPASMNPWAGGGMRSAPAGITVINNNTFNNMRDVTDAKMAAYAKQTSDVTIGRIRELQRKGEF